jgi:hypothetical protein
MRSVAAGSLAFGVMAAAAALGASSSPAPPPGSGHTEMSVMVRGAPEEVFDAMTGEISGWWDHGFTKTPRSRFIEPKPGGGFTEWFDDAGNGVRHATVIYADRGKLLRMSGPLGFSGSALELVTTWAYEPVGDSTRVTVTCNFAGQLEEGWASAIDGVWKHFIVDRFKPWYERGGHRQRVAGQKR